MRKIEMKMNQAIRSQENFKLDNTRVEVKTDPRSATKSKYIHVFLYDNLIAELAEDGTEIHLSNCGYLTAATKSRLNAICTEFAPPIRIYQKNFEWYVITIPEYYKNEKLPTDPSGELHWNGYWLTIKADRNHFSVLI